MVSAGTHSHQVKCFESLVRLEHREITGSKKAKPKNVQDLWKRDGESTGMLPATEWGMLRVVSPLMSKVASPVYWAPACLYGMRKWSRRSRRTSMHHDHMKRFYETLLHPPGCPRENKIKNKKKERSRACGRVGHAVSHYSMSRSRSPLLVNSLVGLD